MEDRHRAEEVRFIPHLWFADDQPYPLFLVDLADLVPKVRDSSLPLRMGKAGETKLGDLLIPIAGPLNGIEAKFGEG